MTYDENPIEDECLVILTEECAEVIQAVSKTMRFPEDDEKNRTRLAKELGDLQVLLLELMLLALPLLVLLLLEQVPPLELLRIELVLEGLQCHDG